MSEVVNKRKPRALIGTDIFLMTSIIGKIGVRNLMRCFNLQEMKDAKEAEGDENAEVLGQLVFFSMIDVVMGHLEAAEAPICKLLARLYDMPESEIAELGAAEYLDMFIGVMKDENFVDFFKHAYESVKQMM